MPVIVSARTNKRHHHRRGSLASSGAICKQMAGLRPHFRRAGPARHPPCPCVLLLSHVLIIIPASGSRPIVADDHQRAPHLCAMRIISMQTSYSKLANITSTTTPPGMCCLSQALARLAYVALVACLLFCDHLTQRARRAALRCGCAVTEIPRACFQTPAARPNMRACTRARATPPCRM
jgi:hypothetical protein